MTRPPDEAPRSGLRRDLGLLDTVGIGLGAIIGAGIFVVTGIAAGIAGPAFIVGLLLAAVAASMNALSAAELAAEYPQSGGTYEYANRLLGPWSGFTAGWLFLASKIAAAGTVALGLGAYLEALVPGLDPRMVAVGAVVTFTMLNYFGVRHSSRTNLVLVAISVGALLSFVFAGAGSFRVANLEPFAPAGARGTLEAAALLFFAYTGYARIATLAEEVQEPGRTIPRAIVITIGSIVLLYLAVGLVAVGAIGAAGMASTPAPLNAAARELPQRWMPTLVSVGGVAAMLGVILSQLLGLSRMVFAMARGGDLPRLLKRVNPGTGVPDRAVFVIGAAAAVVAATGTLRGIASAAAFTILVYYAITNLAALRLPMKAQLFPSAVPAIGLLSCILLAVSLPPVTILTGAGILVLGVAARLAALSRRA